MKLVVLIFLVLTFSQILAQDTLYIQQIEECSKIKCIDQMSRQQEADKVDAGEAMKIGEEILSEQIEYEKCMNSEKIKPSSPCYIFQDKYQNITPTQFAQCQNLCGKNFVNKYAILGLRCMCQQCAGAQCGSEILIFASLLVTILALIF